MLGHFCHVHYMVLIKTVRQTVKERCREREREW